jgi:metallo-beta-lactamase class B
MRLLGLVLLTALIAGATAGDATPAVAEASDISVNWLTGRLYLVEDSHFDATNSLVYIGKSSVTVVGATWTPETARELASDIRSVTDLPIRQVIDTSPDPEWSGGNAYWKDAGAEVVAAQVTCDALARTWSATVEAVRVSHPGYPNLPLAPPTKCLSGRFDLQNGDVRAFYLGPSHTPADIFVYFPNEKSSTPDLSSKPSSATWRRPTWTSIQRPCASFRIFASTSA